MTHNDIAYIKELLENDTISSPCLENGSGLEWANCKSLIRENGIEYFGADMTPGKNVDFLIDFENSDKVKEFESVLILNVLEHVFDPINTYGRSMFFPSNLCIGAVIKK